MNQARLTELLSLSNTKDMLELKLNTFPKGDRDQFNATKVRGSVRLRNGKFITIKEFLLRKSKAIKNSKILN